MNLSDLMNTVREDAPAARYTVDDFVAAGRRRKRRRNSGWAVAAVLAVAVAIGVPQIVARPHTPQPINPAPSMPRPLNLVIESYQVNDLIVGDQEWAGLNNQTTYVGRETNGGKMYRPVGKLTVYRAGYTPQRQWGSIGPTEEIRGRHAFFAAPGLFADDGVRSADQVFVWWYADDALAVMSSYDRQMTRAEMSRLASAFEPARVTQPVLQAYTTSWVPPGLRLAAVENDWLGHQAAMFVPAAKAADFAVTANGWWTEQLLAVSNPGNTDVPAPAPIPPGGVVIEIRPETGGAVAETPLCRPGGSSPRRSPASGECSVRLDAETALTVRGGEGVPAAQIEQIATATRLRGPRADPASWQPATESFPTSAQVPRD